MKSKQTKAESTGLVLRIASVLTASLMCPPHARADDAADVKIPRPLPHTQDIKTPPNNPAKTQAAPATQRPTAPARDTATPREKIATQAKHAPRFDPDQVYFDEPGDGSLWALGASYKARFAADGAAYIPFLGPCAPSDYPIALRSSRVTAGDSPIAFDAHASPVRTATHVVYDRGGIVETYDLTPRSVEQAFVLSAPPAAGDLVLEIGVDTALGSTQDADGLRWSNALGSVAYGRAVVVDASGERTSVETTLAGASIAIRVPAAVLATSAFPIVIDPVISTFTVDNSTSDDTDPDIAYDSTNNVYEVVWSRVFSTGDHDCFSQLQDSTGTTIAGSTVAIDFSSDDWQTPRTANNLIATQFLVAAEVRPAAGGNRIISGRTRNASNNNTGSLIQISDPLITDDQFNVSVGGDPNALSPTYYCVTWERVFIAGTDTDIFARLVLANGTLLGTSTIFVDNSSGTLDQNPSVSRSDGNAPANGQDWTIVWARAMSSTDHDIRGAQVHWDGTITQPSFSIDSSSFDDRRPQASSVIDGNANARNYLVVFQRFYGPDNDIMGVLLNGASNQNSADLSIVENGGFLFQDQIDPCVDSDGAYFAVGYSEQFMTSTTDYDTFVSSFNATASSITALEAHVSLAATSDPELVPEITSRHSGGAGGPRYGIVWDRTFNANDHDVYGAIYNTLLATSYCFPGSGGVMNCPCSNQGGPGAGCNNSQNTGGAVLVSSGISSLSSDNLHFSQSGELATSLSIFLQGNASILGGVQFGDGVRCAGGTLKRLFTHNAVSGTVVAPSGSDLAVHARSAALGDSIQSGSARYYQVYYRDPNLSFCPFGFNVGNARQVAWVP